MEHKCGQNDDAQCISHCRLRATKFRAGPFGVPLLHQTFLVLLPHGLAVSHFLLVPSLRLVPSLGCPNKPLVKVGEPPVELALDGFDLGCTPRVHGSAVSEALQRSVDAHQPLHFIERDRRVSLGVPGLDVMFRSGSQSCLFRRDFRLRWSWGTRRRRGQRRGRVVYLQPVVQLDVHARVADGRGIGGPINVDWSNVGGGENGVRILLTGLDSTVVRGVWATISRSSKRAQGHRCILNSRFVLGCHGGHQIVSLCWIGCGRHSCSCVYDDDAWNRLCVCLWFGFAWFVLFVS
mmetsp:Transcript_17702/g.38349  ORF Transcript_17702/g.38349 Transcript_17702/m.38349 type:complete len:292 (-) Transcript_17702:62-937(-)